MRRVSLLIILFSVLALTAQQALATSVHWKHGSPQFTDNGLTLTETGTLSGVGNGDLLVTLTATGNPTSVCSNKGQHQPPGQNPAPVTLTGSESIPSSAIKNGNADYNVITNAPVSPIPGAPDCPNSNWTETITDVAFTSASLSVEQNSAVVFTGTCTFITPTSNGSVPSSNFTC